MTPTIDALRERYPFLGFALYAYEPGKPVTLECISADGKTFTFSGATEADAILAGFASDFREPLSEATPRTSVFD